MWSQESRCPVNATPETIFSLWSQVEHWKNWDPEVSDAGLKGPFQKGSSGWIKPLKGPKVKFTLTEVKVNESFTDVAQLPFCQFAFRHVITMEKNQVYVTHSVCFTGLLSGLFRRLIGPGIAKGLGPAVQGLAQFAAQQNTTQQ